MTTNPTTPDTLWSVDRKRLLNDPVYAAAVERFVRSRIRGGDYTEAAVFQTYYGPRLVAASFITADGTDFNRDGSGRPVMRPQSVALDSLEDLP